MAELAASFEEASLRLIGIVGIETPLVPPRVAGLVFSCREPEVVARESLRLADPQLVEKANEAWYRTSRGVGLLADEGRFLVSFEQDRIGWPGARWWAEVELTGQWDVMGRGAASGMLGRGRGRPLFVAMSLDGNVLVGSDHGETDLQVVAVRHPERIAYLRGRAEFMLGRDHVDDFVKAGIRRWLGAHPAE
ncbi:hypothetical protein [Lentzea sp. NPDC055074]